MKTKYTKIFLGILCVVCALVGAIVSGCSDETAKADITYSGTELAQAKVGEEYSASVATATGAENIVYALASDSSLPEGLNLSAAGAVSGTPVTAVEQHKFSVTASAGSENATAEFTITVAAASDTSGGEETGKETYTFEAELANLEGMRNMAVSFTPIIFYSLDSASGGKYLGDLGYAGNEVAFEIQSSKATTATLTVTMMTATTGSLACSPSTMKVTVNGIEKTYTGLRLERGKFTTFSIGEITLTEGMNIIKFITVDNTESVMNGVPIMGCFDCIKLTTDAELSWTPNTDNEDIY